MRPPISKYNPHHIVALLVCHLLAAPLLPGHDEVPPVDVAHGPHKTALGVVRRPPDRGLHEEVGEGADPAEVLALPVKVHEEQTALELVPGKTNIQ